MLEHEKCLKQRHKSIQKCGFLQISQNVRILAELVAHFLKKPRNFQKPALLSGLDYKQL